MFGGEGVYSGEFIIGLVVGDRLFLKTGERNRADYLSEGCEPFSFARGEEQTITSYYAVPDRLLDDAEEFAAWARKAKAAAITFQKSRKKSR